MKIGVIGGGQLGCMLVLVGILLGMNFVFFDLVLDVCVVFLGEYICVDYGDQEYLW